jgi:hypothetical protein
MDVFEAIDCYYATLEGEAAGIRRDWVEKHLQLLAARGEPLDALSRVWSDINAFSIFIESTGHSDISSLPHWQYSAFLEWASENMEGPAYSLGLEPVRRILGNLVVFFEFLVDSAHITNLRELSRAYDYICGREEVRLVKLLPYAGTEHWITVMASFHGGIVKREASLSVSDYWLLLVLASTGGSWDHLRRLAASVPGKAGTSRKLAIYNLKRKLMRIGYSERPEDLLLAKGTPEVEEMDKASRWLLAV